MSRTRSAPVSRSSLRGMEDRLAAGLRVSHLLNTVDFEPAGFSPSATLIVRRLRDPMPRQLQADAWAIRATRMWEQAAQSDLSELSRQAARPAKGFVPLNAEAVLFADKGELLACLARDLLHGSASTIWWWRVILRSLPSSSLEALFAAWFRKARYVPSALSQLATQGEAAAVVSVFSSEQAWNLFKEVARLFEVERLCALFERPAERVSGVSGGGWGTRAVSEAPQFAKSPSALKIQAAPWSAYIGESAVPSDLGAEQAALLGVSLALQEAPHAARSKKFEDAFVLWRESTLRALIAVPQPEARARTDSDAPAENNTQTTPPLDTRATSCERQQETVVPLKPASLRSATSPTPASFELPPSITTALPSSGEAGPHWPRAPLAAPNVSPSTTIVPISTPAGAQRPILTGSSLPDNVAPAVGPPDFSTERKFLSQCAPGYELTTLHPKPVSLAEESFSTNLGGAFFLVNLLKALGLPGSLEIASNCSLDLSPWELLELVARGLLSPSHDCFASDSLWEALALLDVRPANTHAGAHFTPSNLYRIPKGWLSFFSPISTKGIRVRLRNSHLELWHADGFPISRREVVSRHAGSEISEELTYLTEGSVSLFPLRKADQRFCGCQPNGLRVRMALRQFLAFLLPYVRARLASALGISRQIHFAIAKTLLFQPAKIWLTLTHVDVVLDLNRASGKVRLSGLDADPGWVPSLGRVVKFHFRKGDPR